MIAENTDFRKLRRPASQLPIILPDFLDLFGRTEPLTLQRRKLIAPVDHSKWNLFKVSIVEQNSRHVVIPSPLVFGSIREGLKPVGDFRVAHGWQDSNKVARPPF
jgi:hypothetical protein